MIAVSGMRWRWSHEGVDRRVVVLRIPEAVGVLPERGWLAPAAQRTGGHGQGMTRGMNRA